MTVAAVAALTVLLAAVLILRARRVTTTAPVVELARRRPGLSLPTKAGPVPAAAPPSRGSVLFLLGDDLSSSGAPPPRPVAPVAPVQVSSVAPVRAPAPSGDRPVHVTRRSPYAAPIVQGTRISLPDDDVTDLAIEFRSGSPLETPIVRV